VSTRTVTDCDVCGVQGLPSAYRVSLASGAVIDVCEGCESGAYPKLMKLIREADAAASERAKASKRSLDRLRGSANPRCNCGQWIGGIQGKDCPVHGGWERFG